MSDVIVFDLYGVIARTQTEEARRRLVELAGVPGERFWEAYWACRPAYDAGQDSSAYWAAVAARLRARFVDVPALVEADIDSWSAVDEEMVGLVCELADQGRTLGLLSNIIEDLVPVWESRHRGWLGRFAALTFSCRIGVAKPDRRAYEICAARMGVAPSRVLFIDDNEANVVAAREAGMSAELFTSPAQVRALVAGR
ncbi:HAD family hydrolase [Nonomuraea muscovyensis]|uniref:Putative hydrolase of the HAD superfamily n=1 Tax=Nonomuraea muscovyensis TaxID=1124761 RepID=A0A7X0C5I9_9ACTN|nr:HAD family phosphatase [Nonomuraea muscovyensis]MBB6348533.1 putative hydrolase of the HAD superfamily [Nonomuraea muscovyensis]